MNLQAVWEEIWKSLLLISGGMLLLRVAGRKSISQMTIPTTIIMISIGTVIVQPIADKSIWIALVAAATIILLLLIVEWLVLKWKGFESFMRGSPVTLISKGEQQTAALKKLRLTASQLDMKLRQQGITRIADVETATLETNGQLAIELTEEAKPVTWGQLKALLEGYREGKPAETEPGIDAKDSLFSDSKLNAPSTGEQQLQ